MRTSRIAPPAAPPSTAIVVGLPGETGYHSMMVGKSTTLIVCCLLVASSWAADSRQAVVQVFKSPSEPTAKDAAWMSNTMFAVGVVDDGSERTGYAEYVCNVLREHGIRNVNAKVIDIAKVANGDGFVSLSKRVDCETFRRW